MCILIDEKAKRPRNRFVYKLVYRSSPGVWVSPNYNGIYKRGRVYKSSAMAGEQTRHDASYSALPYTLAGVYVYLTKKRAEDNRQEFDVILKLEVLPEDWLYSDANGKATYKKVKVISEV